MELIPHADLVLRCKTQPAHHAGPETELLGQVLPLDPGMEHEQDPAQSM